MRAVGIQREVLRVDAGARELAADRERVADDRPLRLAVQAQDLAEVVDQAGDDEPAGLVGATNRLGGLQRVLDLREVDVRIAVVDERVEELERFPHRHPLAAERQIVPLLPAHEIERLVRVIQAVEFLDGVAGFRREVAEVAGILAERARGCACPACEGSDVPGPTRRM